MLPHNELLNVMMKIRLLKASEIIGSFCPGSVKPAIIRLIYLGQFIRRKCLLVKPSMLTAVSNTDLYHW